MELTFTELIAGIIFTIFVIGMLILDMRIFQRTAHFPSFKEALLWSIFWIVLALIFNAGIWVFQSHQKALEFLTGYIVEKSLSVDNIFVFIVIFSYFGVKKEYQHKILFWGILGAIIFRLLFIAAGAALIATFHWIMYVFGAFLVLTAIKLAIKQDEQVHPEKNIILKIAKKIFPITQNVEGERFFVRINGKLFATPLFLVLLVIESTDIVFAIDSIPAIFGITHDVFIIYTSNIFAILGLRALYFLIAGLMIRLKYLQTGLAFVLGFIGIKMLIADFYKIPTQYSLLVIFLILLTALIASLPLEKK
ncbi:MAG: Integral membrane protein TerC [Ignavibacteriae bacterium]|nr:MAG: Integral membrane protein TerC [Ignavibacteriota bacterium]